MAKLLTMWRQKRPLFPAINHILVSFKKKTNFKIPSFNLKNTKINRTIRRVIYIRSEQFVIGVVDYFSVDVYTEKGVHEFYL